MEELIVIKETVVKGYYEEPIYDHARISKISILKLRVYQFQGLA